MSLLSVRSPPTQTRAFGNPQVAACTAGIIPRREERGCALTFRCSGMMRLERLLQNRLGMVCWSAFPSLLTPNHQRLNIWWDRANQNNHLWSDLFRLFFLPSDMLTDQWDKCSIPFSIECECQLFWHIWIYICVHQIWGYFKGEIESENWRTRGCCTFSFQSCFYFLFRATLSPPSFLFVHSQKGLGGSSCRSSNKQTCLEILWGLFFFFLPQNHGKVWNVFLFILCLTFDSVCVWEYIFLQFLVMLLLASEVSWLSKADCD